MKKSYGLVSECAICQDIKLLRCHHLSYRPEITIFICQTCHQILHGLSRVSKDLWPTYLDLVNKYGILWEDGNRQYKKTGRYKEVQKNAYGRRKIDGTQKQYKKLHYDQLKKEHKCTECMVDLPEGYYKFTCESCLLKHRIKDKKRYTRNKSENIPKI